MVWSTVKEMEETLARTKSHLTKLETAHIDLTGNDSNSEKETCNNRNHSEAHGAAEDAKNHKGHTIDVRPSSVMFCPPATGERLRSMKKLDIHEPGKNKDAASIITN